VMMTLKVDDVVEVIVVLAEVRVVAGVLQMTRR